MPEAVPMLAAQREMRVGHRRGNLPNVMELSVLTMQPMLVKSHRVRSEGFLQFQVVGTESLVVVKVVQVAFDLPGPLSFDLRGITFEHVAVELLVGLFAVSSNSGVL